MGILSPYVSMHPVHARYLHGPEESVRSSLTGLKNGYEHP